MKKTSKLLTAGLLVLSMLAFAGCGNKNEAPAGNEAAQQPQAEVYVLGTNPTFAPFESQDEDGNIVGFDIDLMQAIAADQGIELKVESLEFDALIMALGNGSIDIIASGMTITPERLEQVNFTNSYYTAGLNIAVAEENTTINGVADLQGKVVAAQIGTTGALMCQQLVDDGIAKEAKLLADINVCMLDLQNGACDAVINDIPVTNDYVKKNPGVVKVVGENFNAEDYGFAVSKDNPELLDKLNAGLANVIADGTYDALYAKYFN